MTPGTPQDGQGEVVDPDAECCLTCRLRFSRQSLADAHYALTGHLLGWPLDEDYERWPVRGDE